MSVVKGTPSNDESLRSDAILAISHYFLGEETMGQALTRIAVLTVDALPATKFAGLMMISGDEIGTHVFTHPDAPDIDRAQYTAGDGPCLHAFRTGEVVQVPTMGAETRWPLFVEAALQHGILSTLSLPVFGTDGPVGAMNLYSEVEHAFGREEIATAQLLVEQAGYVLVNTDAFLEERQTSAGLRLAIESRSVIDQAKGIIMGAQHVSADEAFALLVKQSQFENVKLRTVADSLVRSTSRSG